MSDLAFDRVSAFVAVGLLVWLAVMVNGCFITQTTILNLIK